MKFNKSSQLLLVSAASLLVAGLVTACGTLTVDFVFVASSKAAGANSYGEIDVEEINSESGYIRHIPTSPFPSGGRNPVAEAVSSDDTNLYVVNQDDNSIVQFIIGNDGKLYPQNTTNTPGVYPVAVAVNGKNLFVVDTYQPLPTCSTAAPCSGSVAVYPISASSSVPPSDALGSPVANGNVTYWPLCLTGYASATNTAACNPNGTGANDLIEPTGINVLASGAYAYVTAYDSTASANYVFGFAVGSGGALTPLNSGAPLTGGPVAVGTCSNAFLNAPYALGTCPSAVASDPTSAYVYVTDAANGMVLEYSVGSSGLLSQLSGGSIQAGNQPSAIVVDPKFPYVYVTSALDSTVSAFSMSSGKLTSIGTYATGSEPVAIGIDPSTSHFLFTANYLGSGVNGTVTGFELNTTAGTLVNTQNSPYTVNAFPTAVAAIPHGTPPASSTSGAQN
ncbi:MAG: beta-propeller fold lactonase family protein [Terracidiphilus sp.]